MRFEAELRTEDSGHSKALTFQDFHREKDQGLGQGSKNTSLCQVLEKRFLQMGFAHKFRACTLIQLHAWETVVLAKARDDAVLKHSEALAFAVAHMTDTEHATAQHLLDNLADKRVPSAVL